MAYKSSSTYMTPPLRSYSPKRFSDTDGNFRNVLTSGAEYVVSYGGTSQYSRDGSGVAAVAFSIEQEGLKDLALLQAVLSRKCAEETTSICSQWSGNLHLEVEDICEVPLFKKTLKLKTTTYGPPGDLVNIESSAAAIITRPPEILACLKLRLPTRNVFVIFDSHPRPSYPDGAGMSVSTSVESTARRLTELLPTIDLQDGVLQWQAQLLANTSGHVFVPHGFDMSMATLWQRCSTEISDLRSQNEFQTNEQQRLESEVKDMEERIRRQEVQIKGAEEKLQRQARHIQQLELSPSSANDSRTPTLSRNPSPWMSQSFTPSPSRASTSAFGRSNTTPVANSGSGGSYSLHRNPPTPPFDLEDSFSYAIGLQHEFDNEDRALSAQRTELSRSVQRLFECGICMEQMPEDSIAHPDYCDHSFCRECMRRHVTSRLDEHRFPILCPTCSVGKGKDKGEVGQVSQSLALDLGLTNEQYEIWTEMELVTFSILLHCRKCERSMFVARDEHEETNIIACPLPDCNHVWCKQCQRAIDFGGPRHSCDGTSELEHLMKEQGWKHCPCTPDPSYLLVPLNFMFCCITPGCNTHFCYICGELIVKSALQQDIRNATSSHFQKNCALFAVPD
ncbi:hypothetical protein B0F90DRAFT_1713063 [Multifurca ochricompacta]|uniref:Uncharacterized protein n=1 Tax=Multifurca ochricompacta TaxID=376703 RepID=A0AAD4QN58_9AGAM|nr:hypothetical protein B0F90DRAFT_1713063 [Multifurca ochricompacta]